MPKLTIEFNLPEEHEDYELYRKGRELYLFMFDWLQEAKRKQEADSNYDVLADLNTQLDKENIHPLDWPLFWSKNDQLPVNIPGFYFPLFPFGAVANGGNFGGVKLVNLARLYFVMFFGLPAPCFNKHAQIWIFCLNCANFNLKYFCIFFVVFFGSLAPVYYFWLIEHKQTTPWSAQQSPN